jgi:twitching motility two-component system response regulator PilG
VGDDHLRGNDVRAVIHFQGERVAESVNLSGVKVMVIDDSNTIRRSAEIFLVQAGCQVILAEDGFDALAKIADHHPDVVFVDIMMPRLDGYQTCALIKKNARFGTTPVIMLSSKDGLFDRARGRMVGSDEYLTKPFTKDSLLKAVATHACRAA